MLWIQNPYGYAKGLGDLDRIKCKGGFLKAQCKLRLSRSPTINKVVAGAAALAAKRELATAIAKAAEANNKNKVARAAASTAEKTLKEATRAQKYAENGVRVYPSNHYKPLSE